MTLDEIYKHVLAPAFASRVAVVGRLRAHGPALLFPLEQGDGRMPAYGHEGWFTVPVDVPVSPVRSNDAISIREWANALDPGGDSLLFGKREDLLHWRHPASRGTEQGEA